jgi:hypothetical protein
MFSIFVDGDFQKVNLSLLVDSNFGKKSALELSSLGELERPTSQSNRKKVLDVCYDHRIIVERVQILRNHINHCLRIRVTMNMSVITFPCILRSWKIIINSAKVLLKTSKTPRKPIIQLLSHFLY